MCREGGGTGTVVGTVTVVSRGGWWAERGSGNREHGEHREGAGNREGGGNRKHGGHREVVRRGKMMRRERW